MLHILLHFLVPALVVAIFYRKHWRRSWLTLVATMLVDLDHLLANPVYDPTRCSIGFHPLHSFAALGLYLLALAAPKTRLVGIGLLIHMVLDSIDCQCTNGIWWQ